MLVNYVLGKGPRIIASDSRRAQKLQWNFESLPCSKKPKHGLPEKWEPSVRAEAAGSANT